jgi:hypothetical protein
VTGSTPVAIALGLQMIGLILRYRLKSWWNPQFFATPSSLPTRDLLLEEDESEKEDDELV